MKNFAEEAHQMAVLDAIENGCTDKNELMEYIKTDTFYNSVRLYQKMFQDEFK